MTSKPKPSVYLDVDDDAALSKLKLGAKATAVVTGTVESLSRAKHGSSLRLEGITVQLKQGGRGTVGELLKGHKSRRAMRAADED